MGIATQLVLERAIWRTTWPSWTGWAGFRSRTQIAVWLTEGRLVEGAHMLTLADALCTYQQPPTSAPCARGVTW